MITRRAVDLLAVLLAALVGIFAPAAVEATAIGLRNDGLAEASAATFIYDGSAVARVDVHSRAATGTAPALLSDALEVSASPSVEARGAFTTRSARRVATEAAGVEGGLPKLGVEPNFQNPAEAPGSGWEWRGNGDPGSSKGSWYNPESGESLHPDLGHPDPIGPHYDWKAPNGVTYRVYPDGTVVEK